jgi:hypothetical protein
VKRSQIFRAKLGAQEFGQRLAMMNIEIVGDLEGYLSEFQGRMNPLWQR